MSAADTTLLTRQREMLLQKLDEFERTNKALRRLLREQQATEVLQSNLILYSRLGFCSHCRCCFQGLLFFCVLVIFFISLLLMKPLQAFVMTVAKWSSLAVFAVLVILFLSFPSLCRLYFLYARNRSS